MTAFCGAAAPGYEDGTTAAVLQRGHVPGRTCTFMHAGRAVRGMGHDTAVGSVSQGWQYAGHQGRSASKDEVLQSALLCVGRRHAVVCFVPVYFNLESTL